MPRIDETLDQDERAQILLYGASKTRKTTWALRAAELGFNVIYCDTDHSYHIAKQLTPEARKRIYHLDMRVPEGTFNNSGAATLLKAADQTPIYYDELDRRYAAASKLDPEREYALLDFSKLTKNDVLVVDSWSALVTHISYTQRPIVDVLAVKKLEWDDYNHIRLALDVFITNLTKLPCHVIVVGHSETYAKRRPDANPKDKPHEAIEQVRMQPFSATRAHGEQLSSRFVDTLYFEIASAMAGVTISTRGSNDFDAGSRTIAPATKKFDDLQFDQFVSKSNLEAVKSNMSFSSAAITSRLGADFIADRGPQAATIKVGTSPFTIKQG